MNDVCHELDIELRLSIRPSRPPFPLKKEVEISLRFEEEEQAKEEEFH